MMLAVSVHKGLALHQSVICTAFGNGELQEEVYLQPPAGAEHLAGEACRAWRKRLN
jgi:hypothetical protein